MKQLKLIQKNSKKFVCVFVCCLLSILSTFSQTLCLEDNNYIENITNKNGEIIGGYFTGGATEQDENYTYPKLLIYIENLNTLENVGIKEYYYNAETKEKGTETYMVYSATDNKYFEINQSYNVPYAIYYTLLIDGNEYELDKPVWGYKSPATNLQSININLKVTNYDGDKIKVEEEEKKGILETLLNIAEFLFALPQQIIKTIIQSLETIVKILFVPADGAMDGIKEIGQKYIIDKVPALNLPIKLLQKINETFNIEWIGRQGFEWNSLKLGEIEVIPAGAIDYRHLQEGGIGTLHNITIIFTSATLSIYFIQYIKKKIDKII